MHVANFLQKLPYRNIIRNAFREKNGIVWEKFPSGGIVQMCKVVKNAKFVCKMCNVMEIVQIKMKTLDRRKLQSCSTGKEQSIRWSKCALRERKGNPSPDQNYHDKNYPDHNYDHNCNDFDG